MKWLAILFTLFILLVIVLADAGILAHYVGFIYEFPFGDKAGHFILYGILTLLLDLALFRARPDQSPRAARRSMWPGPGVVDRPGGVLAAIFFQPVL